MIFTEVVLTCESVTRSYNINMASTNIIFPFKKLLNNCTITFFYMPKIIGINEDLFIAYCPREVI